MMRLFRLILIALAFASPASALDLTVRAVDATGAPIVNAVATFYPSGPRPPGAIRFDWPMQVAQRNITFEPFVLIAPVGADVRFPNFDRVRHHIYSFSGDNRFEIELYGRDETRTHRFTSAGVAAIGCNIHDQMRAFIYIVDTPFAAQTGADGVARLRGVSGQGQLRVWHPYARVRGGEIARDVSLAATGVAQENFTLNLRPPPAHAH